MADQSMQSWLDAHMAVFDVLSEDVTALAKSAGVAARAAERHAPDSELHEALTRSRDAASRLLAEVGKARALPPIPDEVTVRHFSAGLARWADAAETISIASGLNDATEIVRGGNALEAGTDEFLRSAAALRKANGTGTGPSESVQLAFRVWRCRGASRYPGVQLHRAADGCDEPAKNVLLSAAVVGVVHVV